MLFLLFCINPDATDVVQLLP